MRERCRSIYQLARKNAGFTQEEAAELLHVSSRTLSDYERGIAIPPDDVVCRMIEIYKTTWLAYEHLKKSTLIGAKYLPDLDISDLAKSVLRLQKEVKDLEIIQNDMLEVACDGIIEEHEKNKWKKVIKEINEMAAAALSLVFTNEKDLSTSQIR